MFSIACALNIFLCGKWRLCANLQGRYGFTVFQKIVSLPIEYFDTKFMVEILKLKDFELWQNLTFILNDYTRPAEVIPKWSICIDIGKIYLNVSRYQSLWISVLISVSGTKTFEGHINLSKWQPMSNCFQIYYPWQFITHGNSLQEIMTLEK